MKTMTLGKCREACVSCGDMEMAESIDAAISELDELRKIERVARREMIPDVVSWRERAEKAESELAALRKRIADAPTAHIFENAHGEIEGEFSSGCRALCDGDVLLLGDDDGI